MLVYLQSGPLRLAVVLIVSWLSLFTLFIAFSSFLRGPEFQHSVAIIPHGIVEQRVVLVSALKEYPLSPVNEVVLDSTVFPYIPFMLDTTSDVPRINGASLVGAPINYNNQSFGVRIASKDTIPWSTFGIPSTDAVLLNEMVFDSHRPTWEFPKLTIWAWSVKSKTDSQHEKVYLSLKRSFVPQDAFMILVRTNNDWAVQFARPLDASAPNKSLPFLRMLSVFLWPAMFHNFLGLAGLSGVFLIWVCILTAGYAGMTILVTQYIVRRDNEGSRRREGAAQRWEAEGWADMGLVLGDQGTRPAEYDELMSKNGA
ncbi:unnamed protein product [Rhizoctonia solani]|uniref:Transmembrane protein n=1 Tax=Rhizoctonia solani TaxID=456999 RepID=A0A8H2W4Q1_9AGAM|nr:unnamed protein product [Rhizoctonia solani]